MTTPDRSAAPDYPDLPPVVVHGCGGHARVLIDVIRLSGRRILCLTDDDPAQHGREVCGLTVRGGLDALMPNDRDEAEVVNAVGSADVPAARRDVFGRMIAAGYRVATLIHPSAVVAPSASIGRGVQIMAGVVIQPGSAIGDNVLLNTRCAIDHDVAIGDHTHVAPGVTISGNVRVGESVHIGTGASVIQGTRIGRESLVAAGAVVTGDIPSGVRVAGVPARPMA